MNQPEVSTLSLEQQFQIQSLRVQVGQMDKAQAQNFALYVYEQMLIQKNSFEQILRNSWGIAP